MGKEHRIEEIDTKTCLRLLERHRFGRVGITDDHGPLILPVNYVLDGRAIVFRTDPGAKLLAAVEGGTACFELDEVDEKRRFGWSVLVRGRVTQVVQEGERRRLSERLIEPFAGGPKAYIARIQGASITGRRIPLSDDAPDDWFDAPDLGNIWRGPDASDLMG